MSETENLTTDETTLEGEQPDDGHQTSPQEQPAPADEVEGDEADEGHLTKPPRP